MELIKDNIERKVSKIYFRQSVKDIVENQKIQAIKYMLNTLDLVIEPDDPDSESRKKVRKAILDNVNDLHRVFLNLLDSLIDVKEIRGELKD